jgi:hypothetical protein
MSEALVTPSSGHDIYRGKRAVLATNHGKEKAVFPAFFSALGLELELPEGLDTDSLGTFTRDVARHGSMRETAIRKARLGMESSGLPLAVASEGSFGPHPVIPFLAAGYELLVFVDPERGLEIVEEQVSERTNFALLEVTPGGEVDDFLARAGFPEHALVVRAGDKLEKGITSRAHLDQLLHAGGLVQLETDMRAHLNPTRMAEIARLAERLARRIGTLCPACSTPGFGVTSAGRGLPCAECGAPTRLIATVVETCACCRHEQRKPRPDGRLFATPAECPECNP